MHTASLLPSGPIQVIDYVCTATPDTVPFSEAHAAYSLSFVRKGRLDAMAEPIGQMMDRGAAALEGNGRSLGVTLDS